MKNTNVKISLRDSFELFLDRCERENLSPATINFYEDNMNRFIKYLNNEHNLQNPLINDFNSVYINNYLAKIKNSKKWDGLTYIKPKKEKVGSQSVKTYARALRAIGNWFFTEGYISENILETVVLPKATIADKEVISDDEIKTIISKFDTKTKLGLRNSIIFLLAFDTGIRQGGIANLKIGDVDLKSKTLRVQLKGGNITVLPLGNTVLWQIKEYIVKYRGIDNLDEPLLSSNNGSKLTENAIKKMFSKLKTTSGVKRVHCHLGRHTFATNYITEGHTQQELQLALAHESDTMSKKYVHLAEKINYVRRGADSHMDKMLNASKSTKRTAANFR